MTRTRVATLTVLGLTLVASLAWAVGWARAPTTPGAGPAGAPVRAVPARVPAAEVLRGWDEQRSVAYAAGSALRLRDLYVAGSSAGEVDVHLLRTYRDRGYRVTGLRVQVLALRVLEQGADRVRLLVTDRLDRAVAVGPAGRVPLPRDRADRHRITLVRGVDREWRVSEVAPVR